MQNRVLIFHASLALSILVPTNSHTCIHHKVLHEDAPVARSLPKDSRVKRHLFSPLNIHVHMDDMDNNVHENVRHIIDVALKEVVTYIRETFEGIVKYILMIEKFKILQLVLCLFGLISNLILKVLRAVCLLKFSILLQQMVLR